MPRIHIRKIADSCSTELKLLEGQILEAKKAGPFSDLPPIPKGGSITIEVVFGLTEFVSEEIWVVEMLEIFQRLEASGQKLAALRFKKRHDLIPIGQRQVIALPIGHPEFELEEIE